MAAASSLPVPAGNAGNLMYALVEGEDPYRFVAFEENGSKTASTGIH